MPFTDLIDHFLYCQLGPFRLICVILEPFQASLGHFLVLSALRHRVIFTAKKTTKCQHIFFCKKPETITNLHFATVASPGGGSGGWLRHRFTKVYQQMLYTPIIHNNTHQFIKKLSQTWCNNFFCQPTYERSVAQKAQNNPKWRKMAQKRGG